ncbi:hypothetical protein [Thermogemmatispora sp.]|uniref:hypothetical protein n=1 Tax=Thermogemmatispora sp. TaxID=1968838 RepID=UPI0035E4123A
MQPDSARATRNASGLRLLANLMLTIIPVSCGLIALSAYLSPLIPRSALEDAQQVALFLLLALGIQLVGLSASLGACLVAMLIALAFYLAALQTALIAQSWLFFLCPLAFVGLSRCASLPAQQAGAEERFKALALVAVLIMISCADLLARWWQPPLVALFLAVPAVLLVRCLPRLEEARRLVITRLILTATLLLVLLSLLVGLGQLVDLPRGLVALFCCYLGTVGGPPALGIRDRLGLWLTLVLLLLCCSFFLASPGVPLALNWALTLGSLGCLLAAVLVLWLLPSRPRPAQP